MLCRLSRLSGTVGGLGSQLDAEGLFVMNNVAWLQEGNARRKTESTDANAVSSRSHAVLEVVVVRREVQGSQVGVPAIGLCPCWV